MESYLYIPWLVLLNVTFLRLVHVVAHVSSHVLSVVEE